MWSVAPVRPKNKNGTRPPIVPLPNPNVHLSPLVATYRKGALMTVRLAPLKLGLQQITEVTGESLSVIHDAIKAGHLVTFLVGRRRFARPEAVNAWVAYLESQSKAGRPVAYRARVTERGVSHEG